MQSKQSEFDLLLKAGLSPILLKEGTKRPEDKEWEKWCREQPDEKQVEAWRKKGLNQIGLCLGSHLTATTKLIAVDIDNEEVQLPVSQAIGCVDGKVGAKGITIFCSAPLGIENAKIRRKKKGEPVKAPSVEILSNGCQTVVPPSIHPTTNQPYRWVGTPLYDNLKNLPTFDEWVLDEIKAILEDKAQPMLDLNNMVWLGADKGGNTHDSCVSAVGWMVSRSWPDFAIHRRIERAKAEACDKFGEEYNWPQSGRSIQEWIDSAKAKGMEGSSSKSDTPKKLPPEREMALWAIEYLGGADNLACVNGQLRKYKDGHWAKVNIDRLMRDMYLANEGIKEREAKAARGIVHVLLVRDNFGRTPNIAKSKDDPMCQRVCLQNGTLNLKTGVLEPWAREHEVLHQLPISWVDEGDCPLWDQLLKDTSGGEPRWVETLQEMFALSLVKDMSFHKFFCFLGSGGNGKGTVMSVLSALHDADAIGSVSITNLSDERKRTSLVGKLINISGEQSRLNMISDEYLKKITGEDPVDTRKLYGEIDNNVYMEVRFFESMNEMPSTSDNSKALRRRMIILKFLKQIDKPDPFFRDKLMQELPVIFSKRLVPALHDLYARGHFDPPKSSQVELDNYMMENDPVASWIAERCKPLDESERGTPNGDLYIDFSEWAKRNGYKPYTSVFWGKSMTRLGFDTKVTKIGPMSIRTRGIKIVATV